MQTITRGADFTGYLILRHKRCGATKRVFVGKWFYRGFGPDGQTGRYQSSYADCRVMEVGLFDKLVTNCSCGAILNVEAFNPIYGRYMQETICNAKCTGATGPACSCSCGGANHGGKWGGHTA